MISTRLAIPALSLVFVFSLLVRVSAESEESNRRSFEWQVLAKTNFSAQIRLYPHLLLLVTLPWSGKSRSLMREVSNKISYKPDKYGNVKLMVVYKNSEKMLADVLGATEEATLICYHHSTPYRYRGRLQAQNILASVHHLILLQPSELPVKSIRSPEGLLTFLRSTDRSFLLLETCGWSAKFLHESHQRVFHKENISENGMLFGENFTGEANEAPIISRAQNLKDLKNEKLTCGLEPELSGNLLLGGITWENQTDVQLGLENSELGSDASCSIEEFQQFKPFFSKFITLARDYILPFEKQRFGLVSDSSLFPLLGVRDSPTWLLYVHYAGCPNCSEMIREIGELKNAILTPWSLITELQDEGHELEPTIPANKPSIILFIDRSSESSKVRRKSVTALEEFRKLALSSQPYELEMRRQTSGNRRTLGSYNLKLGVPAGLKFIKYEDKTAVMITSDGETVALDNLASGLQSKSTADILSFLIQKSQLKGSKVSAIAKKAGFQLLSDDFEVNVVESAFSDKEKDQSDDFEVKVVESAFLDKEKDQSDDFEVKVVESSFSDKEKDQSESAMNSMRSIVDSHSAVRSIDEISGNILGGMTNSHNVISENSELDVGPVVGMQSTEFGYSKSAKSFPPVSAAEVKEVDMALSEGEKAMADDSSIEGDLKLQTQYEEEHSNMGQYMLGAHEESINIDASLDPGCTSHIRCSNNVADANSSFLGDSLEEDQHHSFRGLFCFSDGGYQRLRSLTSISQVPYAVIVDPILQQHFLYPKDRNFSHSSLLNFIKEYLNGSLASHHMSEVDVPSSKDFPRPPFVNLDFHEAESIPRVTINTFSRLVLGFDRPDRSGAGLSYGEQISNSAWKKDVLVLFGNTWCGFCLRMELVVREVYRVFNGYKNIFYTGSGSGHAPVENDVLLNEMPSIFLMDCTKNDCSTIVQFVNQGEFYPALLLFPAENKTAIPYQGELSVNGIIEFLAAHGAKSHHLYGSKGNLWTGSRQGDVSMILLHEASSASVSPQPVIETYDQHKDSEDNTPRQSIGSHISHKTELRVGVGSVLVATSKLVNSPPFVNSTILIVKADKNIGFQGLIVNKRISWDLLKGIDKELLSLKQAPLSFGGPLMAHGMPLVSIIRTPADEGYLEVLPDFHFGDQIATSHVIEGIKLGNRSAHDYWFFLGYASWNWDQLFDELAEEAWQLSNYQVEQILWPGS